jgi:hypothetical protein
LLRLWLLASALLITLAAVWAFAPILFFLVLLAVGLGLLSALMIGVAHALRSWRERRHGR